jgi:hypothetical protein
VAEPKVMGFALTVAEWPIARLTINRIVWVAGWGCRGRGTVGLTSRGNPPNRAAGDQLIGKVEAVSQRSCGAPDVLARFPGGSRRVGSAQGEAQAVEEQVIDRCFRG